MINAIQELAQSLPIEENYIWDVPSNLPIEIPEEIRGPYARNIYLKENFQTLFQNAGLNNDHDLDYWIIRDWGNIKTFRINENNGKLIEEFLQQINRGQLKRPMFNRISSLSKVAAFHNPNNYSIYDSRAVYALNWLLFRHTSDRRLFPQPAGRSRRITEYDTSVLYKLSGRNYEIRPWRRSYHEYCELLKRLSFEALGQDRAYYLEMLLFVAAPSWVPENIIQSTSIDIQITSHQE